MQTKTIFRPALALLLCGAAMLGLGPWENAAGQGQTPILFSENPQGFNECIANDGVFAIVGDEGDAQCTPRPPGWTPPPPPPPPVVVPDPGGIVEEDEPATPSPPEPARAAVSLFNPPGEPLDYNDHQTCDKFDGDTEPATGFPGRYICSNIDINDTFCIVGSKDALPCKGLFDHVRRCNHYNRAALDPFHCAKSCGKKFACGKKCESAGLVSSWDGRAVQNGPFPKGKRFEFLFSVTASAVDAGEPRYELLQEGSALSLAIFPRHPPAFVFLINPEEIPDPGQKYAATVRVSFSCGGLEKKHGEVLFPFEVGSDSDSASGQGFESLADFWQSIL